VGLSADAVDVETAGEVLDEIPVAITLDATPVIVDEAAEWLRLNEFMA
jgi:hypothetical protein